MPTLKVNEIVSYSGNTLSLGTTGDTINVASGVTFNTASATVNLPTTIKVSTIQNTNSTNLITQTNVTTITFGATSQTISVPSVASFASTIGVGGATPSASGSGITFPATQSASSDANTLDDYEEGTWTPIITGGFTGSPTYTTAETRGYYTKIGNMVYINGTITVATITTAATTLIYGGLPFTLANTTGTGSGFCFIYNRNFASSGIGSLYITADPNGTIWYITNTAGQGINGNNASVSIAGNNYSFMGSYRI
jgi:hypothetical protein